MNIPILGNLILLTAAATAPIPFAAKTNALEVLIAAVEKKTIPAARILFAAAILIVKSVSSDDIDKFLFIIGGV
jgi:hypothetical protein